MKRDRMDFILDVITFILICLISVLIFILTIVICKVEAADFKEVTFAECNGSLNEYIYRNGMLRYEWEVVYEQQRADQLQRWEDSIDNIIEGLTKECYVDIFGYVPCEWEIDLLKRAITAECGYTEPDAGVERVLCVIANRCRYSGGTIYQVLSARGQFETWSNGRIQRAVQSEQVERVVSESIRTGKLTDKNVMYFTAGYYNPYCRPGYKIGNHYFGY